MALSGWPGGIARRPVRKLDLPLRRPFVFVDQPAKTVAGGSDLWVPKTHPPSSGDESVLVDEAAQDVGSSELCARRRRRSGPESRRRWTVRAG